MKLFKLKRQFKEYEKETEFYLIAESEFIGIKEFVLRTRDLKNVLSVNEKEFLSYFTLITN